MTKKQQIPQQQQAAISIKIIVPMRPILNPSKLGPSTSHSKIGIIWLHLWRDSLTTQHFDYHNLVRLYKRNNHIVLSNTYIIMAESYDMEKLVCSIMDRLPILQLTESGIENMYSILT